MRDGLRALGVDIDDTGATWRITPPAAFVGGGTVDCGLAGTVMRFLPPLAALADGPVAFDGDEQAYARPMGPLLDALTRPRRADRPATALPFTVTGRSDLAGGQVTVDASTSSQYVSGLLLIGARLARRPRPPPRGRRPALPPPHRDDRGDAPRPRCGDRRQRHRPLGGATGRDRRRWTSPSSPTCPTPRRSWPPPRSPAARSRSRTGRRESSQPGMLVPQVLQQFGADVTCEDDGSLTVTGTDEIARHRDRPARRQRADPGGGRDRGAGGRHQPHPRGGPHPRATRPTGSPPSRRSWRPWARR